MQQESGVEKSEGENPKTAKWQLQVFNEFLEQHPGIAQDLKKNPNLVNDQHYLSQHSELNEFLARHSDLKDRLQDNPTLFMQQESGVEKHR